MKISRSRLDSEDGRIDDANFKGYGEATVVGSSGSAYTVDLSAANTFEVTLTANCTFTFSNPAASGKATPFTVILKQDSIGGRTATWPSSVVWQGAAPTLSTAPYSIDVITFLTQDAGTTYFGFAGGTVAVPTALWVWGLNDDGQLGISNTTDRSSPAQVGTLTDWVQFSIGPHHTVGLRGDGTAWSMGYGRYGKLGLGGTGLPASNITSPRQIGTLTTWAQISRGTQFSAARTTDGTLWGWGKGQYGAHGLGDLVDRSSPVQIGTLATWASLTVGNFRAFALSTDGALWAWGRGTSGYLGRGNTTTFSSPVQIGTLTDWSGVISAGSAATLAIKADGTLWAWGAHGEVGLGDGIARSSPVQVGTLADWSRVSAGSLSVGVRSDGSLWTWGSGTFGGSGHGDAVSRSSPVQVGTLADWAEVEVGVLSVVAKKTDGTLWSWGNNSNGILGLRDVVHRSSPVQIGTLGGWLNLGAQGRYGGGTGAFR